MITGILLAAGNSSRFGSDKLLHCLKEKSIIETTWNNAINTMDKLVCVVKPNNRLLMEHVQTFTSSIAPCKNADSGMAESIKCGLQHSLDSDAWIIILADMPFVSRNTYRQISEALHQHQLVAPYYQGKRGNPVGFGREYLDELLQLNGDRGARDLLTTRRTDIFQLHSNDAGILRDIDSRDDLSC